MVSTLKRLRALGLCLCLALLLTSQVQANNIKPLLIRPEFGPMHVARFNLDTYQSALESDAVAGYEINLYQTTPKYMNIGTYPLFSTDKKNAFALLLPAGKIPYGTGMYRYRLIAIMKDGSKKDVAYVEQEIQRVLLIGVRPLRVEWEVSGEVGEFPKAGMSTFQDLAKP